MRSDEPQPGNPWPHDMLITIDEPHSLVFLLFVREAWGLIIEGQPRLAPAPVVGESARPFPISAADAEAQWRREWSRAWARFEPIDRTVREPDAEMARLLELPDDELAEAVSTMPSLFWADGIDSAFVGRWVESLRNDFTLPLEQPPERVCLDALVPAWRSGLTTVIQLPYDGYFAERIHRTTLVVSMTARRDPVLYRRALGEPLQRRDGEEFGPRRV